MHIKIRSDVGGQAVGSLSKMTKRVLLIYNLNEYI